MMDRQRQSGGSGSERLGQCDGGQLERACRVRSRQASRAAATSGVDPTRGSTSASCCLLRHQHSRLTLEAHLAVFTCRESTVLSKARATRAVRVSMAQGIIREEGKRHTLVAFTVHFHMQSGSTRLYTQKSWEAKATSTRLCDSRTRLM